MQPASPSGSTWRLRNELLFISLFLVLTALMTWPWVTFVENATPDAGDPYLNAWILWQCFHGFFNDPLNLFHANIFFPYRYSLAFSEHNFGLAVPLFPLFAIGLRPLTIHGILMLLGFAFSGYGAFRLTRTLSGSGGAAFISGIGFAFVLYRFHHLSHVNYTFSAWMPLTLEAAILFIRERTPQKAVWLGVSFLFLGLSCIHWFVLSLIPLGLTALFAATEARALTDKRFWISGVLSMGISAALLAPFFWPYLKVKKLYGLTRGIKEVLPFSALPIHWISPDPRSKVWAGFFGTSSPGELCLFPGMLLLVLPIFALVFFRRLPRLAVATGLIWTSLGFLGSLGVNFPFHRFLFKWSPLFRSIRVPARWAMVADLGLAVLAGLAVLLLAELVRRRFPGSFFPPRAVFCFFGFLLLLDLRTAPLHLIRGQAEPDEVSRYLRTVEMKGGIAVLPVSDEGGPYLSVLRAADHQKPLITAVSGFTLPIPARLESLASERPIPMELMEHLESIPASYLLVRVWRMGIGDRPAHADFIARAVKSDRLRFAGTFGGIRKREDLFTVTKTEPMFQPRSELPADYRELEGSERVQMLKRLTPDPSLMGALDTPPEGGVVTGNLLVRGWARNPGEDLDVRISLNGSLRPPATFRRIPRDDVARVKPHLGDCSQAGYEAIFEFTPEDAGLNVVQVFFLSRDGRVRSYAPAAFFWHGGNTEK